MYIDRHSELRSNAIEELKILCNYIVNKEKDLPRWLNDDIKNIINYYDEYQQKCISAVKESALSTLSKIGLPKGAGLYLIGSVARSEFIPGHSDLDLLIVIPPKRMFIRFLGTLFEHNKYNKILKIFVKAIKLEFSKVGLQPPDDISIDYIPLFHFRRFFDENDICRKTGKEYEAAWAVIERAHFLFEIVFVKKEFEIQYKKILHEIDRTYCITRDLISSDVDLFPPRFPMVNACFALFLMYSGVLAKAGHISKKLDDLEKEKKRGTICKPQEEKTLCEIDKDIAKIELGRIWANYLNIITMHLLFWYQEIFGECGKSIEEIFEAFQAPPLHKAIVNLREISKSILEIPVPIDPEIKEICGNFIYENGRSAGAFPLWMSFLGAFCSAFIIRDDKIKKESKIQMEAFQTKDCFSIMRDANSGLHKLLCKAEHISHRIVIKAENDKYSFLTSLLALLGPFPRSD